MCYSVRVNLTGLQIDNNQLIFYQFVFNENWECGVENRAANRWERKWEKKIKQGEVRNWKPP